MQSDPEAGTSTLSPQPLYSIQETLLGHNETPGWQSTDFRTKQQGVGRRQRPSATVWHLILVSGDMILLLALWGVLLLAKQGPQVARYTSSIGDIKLIWLYLALVSWAIAVSIAQSQKLSYAANRFKGPCCTLFALVLLCIFWMPLSALLLAQPLMELARVELIFLGIAIPTFTVWRFLFAEIMHLPQFRQRAIIVGANAAGKTVARELQDAKHSTINVLGYIDENEPAQEVVDGEQNVDKHDDHTAIAQKSYQNDVSILGDANVLRSLVYKNMIDMIIIALEYGTNPLLFKAATDAAQLGISVIPMAVAYENSTGRIPVDLAGDQWYVVLQTEHILSLGYLCWKKALDLACGIFGLFLLCLVTPVLALFIFLDSPGPIFYSQERVGLRGKPFRIYKFRTMRPDAESEGRAVWAAASDSRITKVGRFLRATHIDELPQLFNILRGDMSLIGPRPERAAFITELEKTVPFYSYRQVVKPGLTGWAQVKYRYGRTGNDALIKLQYDLYYIKKQSFMLDLFIMIKTVAEVLSLRGA